MATINKRVDKDGKVKFQVSIRLKGFPTQTDTFERLTDAKRWVQQTEAAMREGRHFKTAEAKKRTLGEMIDKYIELFKPEKGRNAQLIWWKARLGKYVLADITPAIIALGRDDLLKENTKRGRIRTSSTVVRYIAALSHVFTVGIKEFGWIETSPVSKITKPKEPPGRVRFLSDEERVRLLEACKVSDSPILYLVVVLAISSGMRASELMTLTWSQIDFIRQQIILEKTKNKTHRTIPLTGLALDLLKEHAKEGGLKTNLVFPGKIPNKPIAIRRSWLTALKKAQIKNFRFHDLRHSAASYMAMTGSSLVEIGILLGHKRLEVTKRYSHLSQQHLSKMVERMNEEIFG
jgi:integrase